MLLILVSFRDGLNGLLSRAKSLRGRVLGIDFELDANTATEVLEELIRSAIQELTSDQRQLFLYICQNPDVRNNTICAGPLQFKVKPRPRTVLHWDLRDLRATNLIRVLERGSLRENVHIVPTAFGSLVQKTFLKENFDPSYIEGYLRNRAQASSPRDQPDARRDQPDAQ